MTPNLDDLLRATLRDRSEDITTVPESVFAFERPGADGAPADRLVHRGPPAARRHLLAIAAGVVAVLTLAGVVLSVRGGDPQRRTPPGTQAPTSSPTSTPTPRQSVPRSAALGYVGFGPLPGWRFGVAETRPGYADVGLTPRGDAPPTGANGGLPSTAYVTVYDAGRFRRASVAGFRTLDTRGTTYYLGQLSTPVAGRLPSLAFATADGRWAVVQGRTGRTASDAALSTVARAVRTDVTVGLTLPFRLTAVPVGSRVTRTSDDDTIRRRVVELTGTSLDLQLDVHTGLTLDEVGTVDLDAATRLPVDGRTVYVDAPAGDALVEAAPGVAVSISLTAHGRDDLTASQQQEFTRILTGARWATTDAEAAIP